MKVAEQKLGVIEKLFDACAASRLVQTIAHARVLHMRQWGKSCWCGIVRFSENPVITQTKIAAETEWTNRKNFAFEFLHAILKRIRLGLRRVICRDRGVVNTWVVGRRNFRFSSARHQTFKALDGRFPGADFDATHLAAQRAMRLHIAAIDLAEKIWARTLPYEKEEEILSHQFSEFPAATRQRELSDAHADTR